MLGRHLFSLHCLLFVGVLNGTKSDFFLLFYKDSTSAQSSQVYVTSYAEIHCHYKLRDMFKCFDISILEG